MLNRFKNLTDRYYSFWLRLANLPKKASLFAIDFDAHWFRVITKQKLFLFLTLATVTVIQTFYSIYPLFIEDIITDQNWTHFVYLILFWMFIICLEYVQVYCAALMEVQCINSILYNAFRHFLKVDPLYHTLKSTGKLFSKITRCARAYESFLDIILYDLMPIIVSIFAVVFAFLYYDLTLGLAAFVLLCIIAAVNIILNLFTSASFEKRLIIADDELKSLGVESLTQVQLIRSSFATNEMAGLAHRRASRLMYREGTAWLAFASSVAISRMVYLASVFVLGWITYGAMAKGTITATKAAVILITYLNGTYEIIEVGRRLRKLLRSITRINDLYSFIQMFGKSTFPVLSAPDTKPITVDKDALTSVEAKDIYFYYNPTAKIFDGHNLFLEIPHEQPKKLYGIIGPSGVGKTTLLSLLGGQLKPDKGTVKVNGIPIYEVDDEARRTLIAMQGQVASGLSGTLKRNLILGLPPELQVYTDNEIIRVLKKVGIWAIFEEKQGLASPIGEAGLTLSGGQRQRLNFASLYLRAKYYNPVLILIDEPTSSLDEVSEQAITAMISELSQKALTIVIAHRLNTLHDAIGILDFSLIDQEKDMIFYPRDILEKKSTYYKKLMQGDVPIEE